MPDDFSWSGRPKPKSSGGFVTSIGLNEGPLPLAVDPSAPSARPRSGGEGRGSAGPQLEVEVLEDAPDRRRSPSGRFKI